MITLSRGYAGSPFFMRFPSSVVGSSPVYRFFIVAEALKIRVSALFVSKILQTAVSVVSAVVMRIAFHKGKILRILEAAEIHVRFRYILYQAPQKVH